MAKPQREITPGNRLERWKKLWATPRLLDETETETAFEEFQEAFVPRHMRKQFLKFFGSAKAQFGNRFFMEDAVYRSWDTPLAALGAEEGSHVEVTAIYGSPDNLEGHWLRGESRRTLRDIVIDDWQASCAIVQAGHSSIYIFVEPKMRGCMTRIVTN